MTYKPFRTDRYAATTATSATEGAAVAKVAVVAASQRFQPQEEFEERAAICEHDGGLPRDHAEQLAAFHAMPIPVGITEDQRDVVIDAAARFLERRREV